MQSAAADMLNDFFPGLSIFVLTLVVWKAVTNLKDVVKA